MENIANNTINFAPVVESEDDQSCYERFLNKNSAASKVASTPVASPEHDTKFQRSMTAVVGFLKPNNKPTPCNSEAPVSPECAPAGDLHLPDCDIVIRGKRQLRTLYHLLQTTNADGIPAEMLKHLSGSGNQWDTVSRINKKVGHEVIKATEYPVTNKTGKTTPRANYWLTPDGKRIAAQILANSRYEHDETPESTHLRHPGMMAVAFIDESGLCHEDLLVLRDGTKPQWLRLLYLLRAVNGQWVPRYVADELLDSSNVREVVRVVNLKKLHGPAIESTTKTMKNRDGGDCKYGLYRMADDWCDAADQLLTSSFKVSM